MGIASKRKGKAGEQELARLLRGYLGDGIVRNLMQSRSGGCDLIGLDGWSIEVKRAAKPRLTEWWTQALAQAQSQLPLSQAWPLGGLHRAAPVPFRTSYFTSPLHPGDATVQRLIGYLYSPWSYWLLSRSLIPLATLSWRTGIAISLAKALGEIAGTVCSARAGQKPIIPRAARVSGWVSPTLLHNGCSNCPGPRA